MISPSTNFEWGEFSDKGWGSIVDSTARINIWEGAVRSSKTICSIVRWLEYIRAGPPGPLIMVGKTERTLKRNVIDVMSEMLGDRVKYSRGSGELRLDGRLVYIAGANDERSQEKIRGLTLAGGYGDEVSLWPESMFTTLLSRFSVEGAKGFFTTNPDSPYHWLKVNYIDRVNELDMRVFHFLLEDNPNLARTYVEALKKEYTGLWFKRFIQGLWVQAEGAVYDMWDESIHVLPDLEIPDCEEHIVSIDYGTANPSAFVLLGRKKDQIYAIDEYYWDSRAQSRQKTDSEYASDLVAFIGRCQERTGVLPSAIIADPSASSFFAECRSRGVVMAEANNAVLDGIREVSSLMGSGRFFVAERCRSLRNEISGYVWDEKAQIRGEDKPKKENDHAVDALRYGVMHFLRPGPRIRAL